MTFHLIPILLVTGYLFVACSDQSQLPRGESKTSASEDAASSKKRSTSKSKDSSDTDLESADPETSDPETTGGGSSGDDESGGQDSGEKVTNPPNDDSKKKPASENEIKAPVPCVAGSSQEFRSNSTVKTSSPLLKSAVVDSKFTANVANAKFVQKIDSTFSEVSGKNANISVEEYLDGLFALEQIYDLLDANAVAQLRAAEPSWNKTPCTVSAANKYMYKHIRPNRLGVAGYTYRFSKPFPVLNFPTGDLSKILQELEQPVEFEGIDIQERIYMTVAGVEKNIAVPGGCSTIKVGFRLEEVDQDQGLYRVMQTYEPKTCRGFLELVQNQFGYEFNIKTNKVTEIFRNPTDNSPISQTFK